MRTLFLTVCFMLSIVGAALAFDNNNTACYQLQPGEVRTITVNGNTYNVGTNLNDNTGTCSPAPTFTEHFLGSPSGLAGGTFTFSFGGFAPAEFWITGLTQLDGTFEGGADLLECTDPVLVSVGEEVHYTQLTGQHVWHPCFGGAGNLTFYNMWGEGYGIVANGSGRSTDLNGDGDTDKDDESGLLSYMADYAAHGLTLGNQVGDLNWDNQVNGADLTILLQEADRRSSGQPYKRGYCHPGDMEPSAYVGPYSPIPPATIAGLSATPGGGGSIQLGWTAPGNTDSFGTASQYDLRWSNGCITESNFASATPIATNPPQLAGSTESLSFAGQPSTKYYFAIKTVNDQGNWSAVSNVASNSNVAPPPISTLTAGFGRTTSTTTFTLPTNAGCTLAWEVRVKSSAITTEAAWNSATTLATGLDGPGTTHCILRTSLPSNTYYYFAAKYTDGGVLSPLSNSAGGKTRNVGNIEVDCGGSAARLARQEDGPDAPLALFVSGANPTASAVGLDYIVPSSFVGAPMRLGIFDLSGRRVRSLVSGAAQAGQHEASWNLLDDSGRAATRGLYFARFVVGSEVRTRTIFVNR